MNLINIFKFIFLGKRAIDQFALTIATPVATETAFEKLTRENPNLFTEAHFKLMKSTDMAEAQREWEIAKVNIISEYIGEKKMNKFREEIAEVISKWLNQ